MFNDLFMVVNVVSVRAHAEELTRESRSHAVIGLLETGFRDDTSARQTLGRLYPDHRVLGTFPQDETGVGCALLAHRHARVRAFHQRSANRHRLQYAEVEVRGRLVRLTSLYVPAAGSGGSLDPAFLAEGLDRRCAILAGDLNARSQALGCRTTNSNGGTLADFLLEEGGQEAVVLTDPSEIYFSSINRRPSLTLSTGRWPHRRRAGSSERGLVRISAPTTSRSPCPSPRLPARGLGSQRRSDGEHLASSTGGRSSRLPSAS